MFTRREKLKCASSLVCLLQALAGQRTRLELRNEIEVTGTVVSVDSNMNITLEDAETVKMNGDREVFDEFTVRGAQIRYVHIPDNIDVMAAIKKQVSVLVPGAGGRGERRRQPSKGRRLRHLQERKMAREHKLGRGRGTNVEQGGGPVGQGEGPVEQGGGPVEQGGGPVEQGEGPVEGYQSVVADRVEIAVGSEATGLETTAGSAELCVLEGHVQDSVKDSQGTNKQEELAVALPEVDRQVKDPEQKLEIEE